MVLADDQRIKGYVHPVRMAILRMLSAERRTVTSVAREMRVHPANITHHFKLLEGLGLIRLVETRDTGRNLEKYYASAARSYVVRPKGRSTVSKQALALSILRDNLSVAIERCPARGRNGQTLALLASARLRERDLEQVAKRLRALVDEFRAADGDGGASYTLNVGLYPDDANVPRPKAQGIEIG